MRILYVSQYFPPEIGAPSARVHELSREWVRQGHSVTVLTAFAHHPTGVKAETDRWVLTRREEKDGIHLLRTYVYATANKGIARRMLSYASFMLSAAAIGALRLDRPDVVVATSPQLLCAVAGHGLAVWFDAPFVFEVRDLWPESIIAVDAMRENLVVRGLKKVARHLYRRARRIVTVGDGYKRMIHALYRVKNEKMTTVPNGIDLGTFTPKEGDPELRKELGWGDRFVLLYLGTHGMAHALNKVLEVAHALRNEKQFLFVFVGEGAEKDNLKKQARELALENVQFIDAQPKSRVPAFYAACDLGLVTLRKTPLFQEVLPSKIFEYLGMERPVLLSVDGDARALVETARAGEFVPPEDVPAMVAAIRRLASDRAALRAMGKRGREHVIAHYDRRVLAERYAKLLHEVVARRRA